MRIWAISDLHLGFSTGKWMDVFGDHWKDHHLKVEASWRERVEEEDLVLVPGDLTWAMKPDDARQDLAWLAALPGEKLLVKGNHDYWWPGSHAKLQTLLPPGVHAIKKRATLLRGVPFIGVRGTDFHARSEGGVREVEARLVRERGELIQSIEDLARLDVRGARPIALFHYPPFPVGLRESFFTRILEDADCSLCVYGHLHTRPEWERVFQGVARGVEYRLVSCDALGFQPLLLREL